VTTVPEKLLKYYQLLPQLKSGKVELVYIFLGEENYLKNEAIQIIKQHLLKPDFALDFNFNHLYGLQTEVDKIIEIANTLPAFNNKRLVVVDEFEKLKKIDKLNKYLENPVDTTCLILNSTSNNVPSGIKLPQKNCVTVIFYPLWENELYRWIINKVREYGKNISSNAVEKLIEYCDNSLFEINQELKKLIIYIGEKKEITINDVLNLTGDMKKFSLFALTDAISQKNFENILKIFRRMVSMGIDVMKIFGAINNFFHTLWQMKYLKKMDLQENEIITKLNLNPTRYKKLLPSMRNFSEISLYKIILLLAEYDKKLKTISIVPKNILIEEMLYKICFS